MGQKRVSHSVEWNINVGYTLLALLGLFVAYKLSRAVTQGGSQSEGDSELVDESVGFSETAETIELT